MSVWNVFKDRLAFVAIAVVGVACRKRVQRYSYFLNYKTFYKEIFEKFLSFFTTHWYSIFNKIKKFTHFWVIFANNNKIELKS